MLNPTRFLALALTPFVALSAPAPGAAQDAGPPGMVFIKGGRYKIGIEKDEALDLIEKHNANMVVSETPQYEARLDDFYFMPTELTNEQFAKYVTATDSRPPQSWGQKAIDDATIAYATDMGKQREEARANGEDFTIPPFDRNDWWQDNWMEAEWAIPKGQGAQPVVYIDFEQAEGYARWAGVRLISEEEFQAVARGNSERPYTWGDEFDPKAVNCTEARRGGPAPVGTFPKGAVWVDEKGKVVDEQDDDTLGVYDLCGNVWEWTRTPMRSYDKFKPLEVKNKATREKETITYEFEPNNRSSVGGGFNVANIGVRLTTRRNTARYQSTAGLGMRCSASTVPGLDIADSVLRADLPPSRRPEGAFYVADKITAIDRWTSTAGTADIDGYRVIESYDYLAFIPNEKLEVSSTLLLKDRSQELPHELGAFSTTMPLLEPALPAGTYTLSWRAANEFNVPEEPVVEDEEGESSEVRGQDGDEALEEVMIEPEYPFDPLVDTLIFRDLDGEIVGWIPVAAPGEERLAPGKIALKEIGPEEAVAAGTKAGTELTFQVYVPYTRSNKGFLFEIPVLVKGGVIDETWRR